MAVYVYDTTPPTGYSVNIDQEAINNDNKAAMSFTFAGAEVGASYNYTVTSTGGGSVTGSGTIETVDQQIGDIDVSGLGDGTLILIVTLIDLSGNSGAIVTDTVSKNTAAPMDAAVPVIISDLSTTQVEYNQNAAAAPLDATATVTDGGTITYQWYSNTTNSTVGATALGVTTPAYTPSTATVGTTYYYCVVTNTNNAATGAKAAQTISPITGIKVNSASGGSNGGSGSSGGGGSRGSSSSSTVSNTPVITVSEVKSELFSNPEDVKVEADVTSAFGQSVTVKITDAAASQDEIFSLAGASDKVYPFDISLYSKDTGERVQPKDGYSVKITLPVPEELLNDREKIKVVYGKDGKLETLKSELIEKWGKWYITFEAIHFSPYALIVSAEEPAQPETDSWINPFSDVKTSDWYYFAVQYAVEKGLKLSKLQTNTTLNSSPFALSTVDIFTVLSLRSNILLLSKFSESQ